MTLLDIVVKVPSVGRLEAAFYLRFELLTRKWLLVLIGNKIETHNRDMEAYFSHLHTFKAEPPIPSR